MEDQRLVQLALTHGYVTAEQVERAQREQKALADRGIEHSLWFLLQDLGFIADDRARDLRRQTSSARVRALVVDGYTVQGRLGSGGMGDVFIGRHRNGDEAAVKMLASKLSNNDEHVRRFLREARASMRLRHPHITRTLSSGEVDGSRYIVMELVRGPSLKQHLVDQGPLREADALVLLWQMAHALGEAWRQGVLHRDVKPANIMLAPARDRVGEPFCAKICDFGLAKVSQAAEDDESPSHGQLTGTGLALGTPHYMSPEQASGEHDVDARADIYGLGATLYHTMLGQTLYSGKSSAVIMYKQVTEVVDVGVLKAKGIHQGLVDLLGAMLAKSRAKRIASWEAVLSRLGDLAPEMVAAQTAALARSLTAMRPIPAGAHPTPRPAPSQRLPPPPPGMGPAPATIVRGIADGPMAVAASTVASPAASPPPAPGATAGSAADRPAPMRGQRRPALVALAAILLVLGAALGGYAALGGGAPVATPATFAGLVAGSRGRPTEIRLAPGTYPGPWRFGAAHSGLRLRADAPGVIVSGAGLDAGVPTLRCEPGLGDFSIHGVALIGATGTAVEVMSGAHAGLVDVIIEDGGADAVHVDGGDLNGRGLRVRSGGVRVGNQGRLVLEDSVLRGGALTVAHATVEARRCRFAVTAPLAAVIGVESGALTLDTVVVEAAGGEAAIRLDRTTACTLVDVALRGARTGVSAHGATLSRVDGLTSQASAIALAWSGPRDREWHWQGLRLDAHQPLQGLAQIDAQGTGARADRLRLVPDDGPVRNERRTLMGDG